MGAFSPVSAIAILDEGGGGGDSVIYISAESSKTIETYAVPQLTNTQVLQAYNAVVAGKRVYIKDSLDFLQMPVNDISSAENPQVSFSAVFRDVMLLKYTTNSSGDTASCDLVGTKLISTSDTNLFEYVYSNGDTSLERTIKG